MASKLAWSHLIAAQPALVTTISADAFDFLRLLPEADFTSTHDTKALWAVQVTGDSPGAQEGSVFPGTGGTAASWIVSAEAHKRLIAQRF